MPAALEHLQRLAVAEVPADLAGRAAHVARVADAIEAAADALPAATAAATDLRAALGAMVAWSRGPRTDTSTAELLALMTALLQRAQATLLSALADHWRVLADEGAHERAAALSDLFARAAAELRDGGVVGDDVRARIAGIA
jgi:hypothetical protein